MLIDFKQELINMSSPARRECREALRLVMDEHARQLRSILRELALKEGHVLELEAEVRELRRISQSLDTERELARNASERLDGLETSMRLLRVTVQGARAAQHGRLMTRDEWFNCPTLHPEEEEALRLSARNAATE